MGPRTILAGPALCGPLIASSTSRAHTLGSTSTGINVLGSRPGRTGVFKLGVNNLGQSVLRPGWASSAIAARTEGGDFERRRAICCSATGRGGQP
jgi:hypothetical protein